MEAAIYFLAFLIIHGFVHEVVSELHAPKEPATMVVEAPPKTPTAWTYDPTGDQHPALPERDGAPPTEVEL